MHTYERGLHEQYKGRPLVLLGVNCDSSLTVLRSTISREAISWRIVWDGPAGSTFASWDVARTPSIYLVDPRGVIRYKHFGAPDRKALEQQINALLQETS
jgi:hypothetical protein